LQSDKNQPQIVFIEDYNDFLEDLAGFVQKKMGVKLYQVFDDNKLTEYRRLCKNVSSGVFLLDKKFARGTNLVF